MYCACPIDVVVVKDEKKKQDGNDLEVNCGWLEEQPGHSAYCVGILDISGRGDLVEDRTSKGRFPRSTPCLTRPKSAVAAASDKEGTQCAAKRTEAQDGGATRGLLTRLVAAKVRSKSLSPQPLTHEFCCALHRPTATSMISKLATRQPGVSIIQLVQIHTLVHSLNSQRQNIHYISSFDPEESDVPTPVSLMTDIDHHHRDVARNPQEDTTCIPFSHLCIQHRRERQQKQ